jgi:hypothetical protein
MAVGSHGYPLQSVNFIFMKPSGLYVLEANLTPKARTPHYKQFPLVHTEGFGFYLDERFKVYRRPHQQNNLKFQEIIDHLYAKKNLVNMANLHQEQPVYCFRDAHPPGNKYTLIRVEPYSRGQMSGSAPVAGDAPVAGGGQGAQGVETRGRGRTRGTGGGTPPRRELSINATPFEPSSRRELSTDAPPVVPCNERGLNPNAAAYFPTRGRGLSSDRGP